MQQLEKNRSVSLVIGKPFSSLEGFVMTKALRIKGTTHLSTDYEGDEQIKKRKAVVDQVNERFPFLNDLLLKGNYEPFVGIRLTIEEVKVIDNELFGPNNTQIITKEELLEIYPNRGNYSV